MRQARIEAQLQVIVNGLKHKYMLVLNKVLKH